MLTNDSNPKCGILYIDDEGKALKYFKMAFAEKYTIFTAPSGKEGLEILRREAKNIGIVISDQRMPEMLGAEILGKVREEYPNIVRLLTTAYSDLESAIQAVNQGYIYQYVVKPWEIPDLHMVLQRAADYYQVLSERNELLALKMTTLQRIVCSDRFKWLLVSSRYWEKPAQAALNRVLLSLIDALPGSPSSLSPGSDKFSARNFEIGDLIRNEYRNASHCLDLVDKARPDLGAVEPKLQALRAALRESYNLSADQADLSFEAGSHAAVIQLRPAAKAIPTDDFSKALFGILFERTASEISIQLFEALLALATVNGSLTISLEGADPAFKLTFSFSKGAPSPEETIEHLAQKFASWDIARI